jgi:hypothetical protein
VAVWDTPIRLYDVSQPIVDRSEIVVVDLTTPAGDPEIGSLVMPGDVVVWSVASAGTRPLLGVGSRTRTDLWIADVADPATPTIVGGLDIPDVSTGPGRQVVAAESTRAWVAAGDVLQVVDVSDPGRARRVGAYHGWLGGAAVRGDATRAVVAAYRGGAWRVYGLSLWGLHVFEPLTDGRLHELLALPVPEAADVQVADGRAFALTTELLRTGVPPGVEVLDISATKPDGPRDAGSHVSWSPVRALGVFGDLAFLTGPTVGLRAVALGDGAHPREIAASIGPSAYFDVAVSATRAYAARRQAIDVLDVADPAQVRVLGSCTVGGTCRRRGTASYAECITVSGDTIVYRDPTGLYRIDVSDPSRPRVDDTLESFEFRGASALDLSWPIALVGMVYRGVGVVEVHQSLDVVSSPLADDPVLSVAIDGDRGFVVTTGYEPMLQVLDLSSPRAPTVVGRAVTVTGNVGVAGARAWVAGGWPTPGDIRVLDVANPSAPVEIGRHIAWWTPTDIVTVGARAYVTTADAGLWVLQVSRHTVPPVYLPVASR